MRSCAARCPGCLPGMLDVGRRRTATCLPSSQLALNRARLLGVVLPRLAMQYAAVNVFAPAEGPGGDRAAVGRTDETSCLPATR